MAAVIGVGSSLVDQLSQVPDSFLAEVGGLKGGMELIDHERLQAILATLPGQASRVPGGSAANTIVGMANLGMSSGMLSKVGTDEAGEFYRRTMALPGVSTTGFKFHPSEATGCCLSLITPDSQRTMRTFLGASATLAPEDVSPADFATYSHVHAEGYLLFNEALMRRVLESAHEAGCTVSLDLAAPEVVMASMAILPELLRDWVDMVFANEDEAAAFCGSRDEAGGLQALGECCDLAVVKLGARGALIQHRGERVSVPARRVDALDTTGAGDLWAAGFLHSFLTGGSLQRSGELGAAVAAEVVQNIGATIPDAAWLRLRQEFNL
jgi:sugar/nucleoside kinase (ribokinase family)